MQNLTETGFEGEQDESEQEIEQPQDMEVEEEPVTSSTDYLFNKLKQQGIINENNEIVSKEAKKPEEQKTDDQVVEETGFTPGVYLFEDGLLIAPATADTPPQKLLNM